MDTQRLHETTCSQGSALGVISKQTLQQKYMYSRLVFLVIEMGCAKILSFEFLLFKFSIYFCSCWSWYGMLDRPQEISLGNGCVHVSLIWCQKLEDILYILDTKLTHLHLDKMAAICQTIFSVAVVWIKRFVFCLKFRRSLFRKIQLKIAQHWFR